MARQSFTKKIGENTYEVEQLHLLEAKKVLLILSKKLGPGLAKILSASDSLASVSNGLNSMATQAIADGLLQLVQDIDEKSLETIQEAFGKSSKIITENSSPIMTSATINNHFHGGNMSEYFGWISFCIEVNFVDFLSALGMKKEITSSIH